MDFIFCLPKSKRDNIILVVVDRLSKYKRFIPIKHPYTARHIAETFVNSAAEWKFKSILNNRDPLFMSKFWQELFSRQGTKLDMISSFHPESDGPTKVVTEVVNQCLVTYLRCFASSQPRPWSLWLCWVEFKKPPTVVHIPEK